MDKIRTLLIDDEPNNRKALRNLLGLHCENIQIIDEASGADEAFDKIKMQQPQLIFLDVKMPNKTGFDLLRMFLHIPFEIIFISAYDGYALNAFEFSAIDYILKPVDYEKLKLAVDRATLKLQRATPNYLIQFISSIDEKEHIIKHIPVYKTDMVIFIDLDTISYIISQGSGYSEIFTTDGRSHLITKSLVKIGDLLINNTAFVKANKSVLLNTRDIKSYKTGRDSYIQMSTNDYCVEVSRRRKKEIVSLLK